MKQFAEIIDKGGCYSTLNAVPELQWPDHKLKQLANRDEWSKYNFYPSNGLVGEITYTLKYGNQQIIILRINNRYYVPMSAGGIRIISEEEWKSKQQMNTISNMDDRQRKINMEYDSFQQNLQGTSNAFIYCQSSKIALAAANQSTHNIISKISRMLSDSNIQNIAYERMINDFVENTKRFVIGEKWDLNDEQGFSWFLGMICKAATLSHPSLTDKYDQLFVDSFNKHFN